MDHKYILRPSLVGDITNNYVLEELNLQKLGENWSDIVVDAEAIFGKRRESTKIPKSMSQGKSTVSMTIEFWLSPSVASENYPNNAWLSSLVASLENSFANTQGASGPGVVNVNITGTYQTISHFSEPSLGSMQFVLTSMACETDGFEPTLTFKGPRGELDEWLYGSIGVMLVDDDLMQASIRGAAYPYNRFLPFTVVQDDWAVGDYTFAHEIGHIMGGSHPTENNPNFVEGYGFENFPSWQTMMGGYDACIGQPGAPFCPYPRQQFWSNPNKVFQGQATGVNGSSDMRDVLNVTLPEVADWWRQRSGEPDWAIPQACFP